MERDELDYRDTYGGNRVFHRWRHTQVEAIAVEFIGAGFDQWSKGVFMSPINWKLIGHPLNWIIVLLMLVIAGIFGHLLLTLLEQEPATAANTTLPQGLATA